jgi:predicted nucleotidyltransferase
MDALRESILKVVTYFDIFQYPVTAEEIRRFMDMPCSMERLEYLLQELLRDERIFKTLDFYTLHKNSSLGIKRIKENTAAKKQLKRAKRIAAFLTWFPFIKGIAISGSLSKYVAKEDSDIDFFIITTSNRLWLSKIFFTSFIKLASFVGLEKWFCLNYVIDETYLEVSEKNIFTAIEIITLMPLHGSLFDNFFEANNWVYDFFPNHNEIEVAVKETSIILPRKIIEWILNTKQGDRLDDNLMKYFRKRWERLAAKNRFTKTGFQIGTIMAEKHFCRPYPEHFQQKILDAYQEKLEEIRTTLRIAI